ncbi:RNI-like protein [Cristinia sonorae]|uniref:RNI-like protein n=1 Tax=Cristinia sonorae TaxID=1940300 RepID=A0A8K0UFU3_9AGAR|nr:RNI-like protein [Cristinia sonorae]
MHRSLTSRQTVDLSGRGLRSSEGATNIIHAISGRQVVTQLVIGHNPLGNDGCERLFNWLASPSGQHYRIQTLYLNVCNIGDYGLLALCQYLTNNVDLKALWLQSNEFSGDPDVMAPFIAALNSSRIEMLSFSNSRPEVITALVRQVDTPFLRELQCSMCALRSEHAASLVSYVISGRCRLHTLRANANSIGLRAVRELVSGIEAANYSLLNLDLYMNGSVEDDTAEDIQAKEETSKLLKLLLARNLTLKHSTEAESFALLRYSRRLLLCGVKSAEVGPTFGGLPIELRLYILSFLAPTLSALQRIRIFSYASDPATLPSLLPSLTRPCLPDPASLQFANSQRCDAETCAGSASNVVCSREESKKMWLASMGCDCYDPGSCGVEDKGKA